MTQKDFLESYTKQQIMAKHMLIAMKNNDHEKLAKYTPALLLEIFKNHSLTDASSAMLIDSVAKDYLMTENKISPVTSLVLDEDEG